jgi:hypothetical protein
MKIRIGVKDGEYFLKLLYILYNVPPFNSLRKVDLIILSELYEHNYKFRSIPVVQRNILVFSFETKKEIMTKHKITQANFYNSLSRLRKLNIIIDNTLAPKYVLWKHKEVNFIFEDEE